MKLGSEIMRRDTNKYDITNEIGKIEDVKLIGRDIKLKYYQNFCVNVVNQLNDILNFTEELIEMNDGKIESENEKTKIKLIQFSIDIPNIRKKIQKHHEDNRRRSSFLKEGDK